MQAKPGAALIAPGGEERIEGATPDVERHAAAIVGKKHLDIVRAGFPHLDIDRAGLAVREGVRHQLRKRLVSTWP